MKSKEKIKIYSIIVLFTFLLFNIVSAQSTSRVWQQYGGELTKITHSQNPDTYSDITNLTSEIKTSINGMSYDNTYPTQPLITDFLDGGETRLVLIQNGNYLQFFDEDFILFNELDTGNALVGQNQIGDFNNDGLNNEIAGLYRINNTNIQFRYYQFNVTSNNIVLLNSTEYTETFTINSTGVRCIGGSNSFCAFQLGNSTNTSLVTHYFNGLEVIGNSNASYGKEVVALEDVNNDGFYEGLVYSTSSFTIYNLTSGNPITTINPSASHSFANVRIIRVDGTPIYKYAVTETFSATSCKVRVVRIDGTQLWSTSCGGVAPASYQGFGTGIYDYNGDGFEDVWFGYTQNSGDILKIYSGSDGTELFTSSLDLGTSVALTGTQIFTIARMSSSTTPSIIYTDNNRNVHIYNPANPSVFQYKQDVSASSGILGCAIGDLNFDSFSDIVCSDDSFSVAVLSNQTNENAEITSVTYSPSTNIQVGESVNALITCTDAESDPRLYSIKCDTGLNFSSETFSSGQSCLYSTIGIYTMTLRCRDVYHDSFSTTTQSISVTNTGLTCNDNGICDSGETNVNCPNDCFASSVDYSQSEGGLSIPTQLVDVEGNTETGLLPEIYYGTLAFLSNVLQPMIVVIFMIFFVLIMFAIGTLIKNLANKIG